MVLVVAVENIFIHEKNYKLIITKKDVINVQNAMTNFPQVGSKIVIPISLPIGPEKIHWWAQGAFLWASS